METPLEPFEAAAADDASDNSPPTETGYRAIAAVGFVLGVPFAWWGGAWVMTECFGFRVSWFHNLGDAFAPIAGAFSAATLLLVLDSIRMQRDELALQRQELTLQRKAQQQQVREFALQRIELAEQARALHGQLAGMEAQRATMDRANTIAMHQASIDAFRLRDAAHERAEALTATAIQAFSDANIAHPTTGANDHLRAELEKFAHAIRARDEQTIRTLTHERAPWPQFTSCQRLALEAIRARERVAHAEDFLEGLRTKLGRSASSN